jgi:AraC-like DNA-binding protein
LRFEQMLDHQRRERVHELLTGTGTPLSHVAGLVGFSEQSSLTRSCRRWFRMTPRALRQRRSNPSHGAPAGARKQRN